jgi:hypothetical protein
VRFSIIFAVFTVTSLEESYVKHRVRTLRSHYFETDYVENFQHSMSLPTQSRYHKKINFSQIPGL